jgi:hypothetical protein
VVDVAVTEPAVRKPIELVEMTAPALKTIKVEVACVATPPHVLGVKGHTPPPPEESVPQERMPFVDDLTSQAAAFRPETIRFVVDAVVAVTIVVEA